MTDFLEIYEVHHNTFNNYQRQDQVTKNEFFEFYRTLNPSYDDDASFVSMVKGVWGITNEQPDVSKRGWAGGNDPALNSRDRYQKANFAKGTPFGTSQGDSTAQWGSSAQIQYTKYSPSDVQNMKGAGAPTKQNLMTGSMSSRAS